ncbi:MAG: hypothetical protein ACKVW3_05940 [Phycisphaerales bacterium]
MTDNLTASPTTSNGGYPRPGGTLKWTDPTNVYSANTQYASVYIAGESKTEYLRAGGFALSALPDDARIRGFVVSVRRYASASNTIKEAAVTLVKEDYTGFINRATGAYVGTSLATVQYGSSTDVWEEPYPVPSSVKAANFGVLVGYNNDEIGSNVARAAIYVDHVEITVYYDPAPDCEGLTVTSAWAGDAGSSSGYWDDEEEAAGSPDSIVATGTASVTGETAYLTCTNFDLDYINPSHVIDGVRVTIKARMTGAAQRWHYVECRDLVLGQVSRGKWPFVEPVSSLVDHKLGDSEELWPPSIETFEPGMFNDETFFVVIQLRKMHTGESSSVEIDAVKVTVWHHAP